MVKNLPAMQEIQLDPWVGKIPWGRKWQPTLVFLSGRFHGQRSLAGYSPWGHTESDTTEQLTHHTHTHRIIKNKTTKICKIISMYNQDLNTNKTFHSLTFRKPVEI